VLELTSDWLDRRLEKKGLIEAKEPQSEQPQEDAVTDGGTIFQKLQKKYAERYQQHATGGKGDLTAIERLQIETFALIRKYRLDPHNPNELPADFVEEENALTEAAVEQAEEELAAEVAEEAAEALEKRELSERTLDGAVPYAPSNDCPDPTDGHSKSATDPSDGESDDDRDMA